MFESVDFIDFKGIRRCEKPIELAKFTLLIGPNNAGKSSVLEGLFLLPCPWTWHNLPILGKTKLEVFNQVHGGAEALVYRYSGKAKIRVKLEGKDVELRATPRDFEVSVNGERVPSSLNSLAIALRDATSDEINEELLRYTAFIPNNSEFVKTLKQGLIFHWNDVEKTNAHVRAIRDWIVRAVEDGFTEVLIRYSDMAVRKEVPNGVCYVRLEDLGDGVKRFLPAILWIETLRPRVVLWDDLEAAAHPALVKVILERLLSGDWQVVAATHSLDVLNSFVELDPEEGKVVQLWKSADDVLHWKSLTVEDVEKLLESGQDVRKILRW